MSRGIEYQAGEENLSFLFLDSGNIIKELKQLLMLLDLVANPIEAD